MTKTNTALHLICSSVPPGRYEARVKLVVIVCHWNRRFLDQNSSMRTATAVADRPHQRYGSRLQLDHAGSIQRHAYSAHGRSQGRTGDEANVAQGDNFLSIIVPIIMASSAFRTTVQSSFGGMKRSQTDRRTTRMTLPTRSARSSFLRCSCEQRRCSLC